MAAMSKRVGWIGLGDLGGAMARRIQTHGIRLTVYDIDPQAVRRLTDLGALPATSIGELAERSDVVMLSLPHPNVMSEIALGEGGLIHTLAAGSIVCDTSTNGREAVVEVGERLATKGIRMVEAPIGKGPWAAEKGDLTILMGGDRATLGEIEFLFKIVGSELYHCGPLGAGQVVKVANNLASCANLAVAAEAYALAARGGADLAVLTQIMPRTAADSWHLRNTWSTRWSNATISRRCSSSSSRARTCSSPSPWPKASVCRARARRARSTGTTRAAPPVTTISIRAPSCSPPIPS